jgi:adenylosuccinate synthase
MRASVIIGANYGDEGKGLMTDYLCRLHNADLVARFNGGAQAGHTVVTPEGQRHVFNHLGSGYYAGVPTYLSEYFILNPIIFKKEYTELNVPSSYKIYSSPNCYITTYWDMLANRCLEELRGKKAHGSCGCGINETIERYRCFINFDLKTWVSAGMSRIEVYLDEIAEFWFERLEEVRKSYGMDILPKWVTDIFARKDEINRQYTKDVNFMFSVLIYAEPHTNFLSRFNYVVFEGAQGLGLDQFYGNYPHVTSSNTGMRNVLEMQRNSNFRGENNFEIEEIVYVSRTYETRHGRDPFFNGDGKIFKDTTNIPNEWQGTIRFQDLSYTDLGRRIFLDISANNLFKYRKQNRIKLALTHTDQRKISNNKIFYHVGRETDRMVNESTYESLGETYRHVRRRNEEGHWERLI